MIILRQRNYGLGSKVLAIISPNAWAGKELAKFSSSTKGEYKRKRLKYMLKGILAPMSTRKMLGKAQDMNGRGYDCDEIAENTKIGAGRVIGGAALGALTGGTYNQIGHGLNAIHGIRTKINENDPGWRKKFE